MVLISFVFVSCSSSNGNNSSNKEPTFNPTLTTKYIRDSKDFVKSLECYNDICVAGTSSFSANFSGEATVLSIQSDGSAKETLKLYSDNNDTKFGYRVAIDKDYILVGSKYSGDLYLYRYQTDADATLIEKIDTNLTSVEALAINNNFFVVSNSHNTLLYRIDNDKAVLKTTLAPQNNDTSLDFGFNVDLSKDYLIVGQRDGVLAFVYSYDSNGTVRYIQTIHSSLAKDSDNYFNISLYGDKFLMGLNGATLYKLSKEGNASEIIIEPMDGATDKYAGRSVTLNDKYLAVEDQLGDSIYTINGDEINPLYRINDTKEMSYNLSIQGSSFTKSGYAKIHYADGTFYFYDFYPVDRIYNYKLPNNPIILPEQESPCSLFEVDALSNDGNLSYRLEGDDSAWFDMNGTTLINTRAFDYESPIDTDEDNTYKVTIVIEDEAGHSVSFPVEIDIENHNYVYNGIYKITSKQLTLLNNYQSDIFAVSYDEDQALVNLLHIDGESITKTNTITSPRSDDFTFGNAVAGNAQMVIVSSDDLNQEDDDEVGVAFSYKKENNGTLTYFKQLVGDDSEEASNFGSAIFMDDTNIAIGANHKYARTRDADGHIVYRSGAVYIYANDDNLTRLQKIKPNTGIRDVFGKSIVFNDWLMAISSPGIQTIYLYIKDKNGTWISSKELNHKDDDNYRGYGDILAINDKYLIISGYSRVDIYSLDKTGKTVSFIKKIDNTYTSTISLDGDDLFIGMHETVHYHLSLENKSAAYIETMNSLIIQPGYLTSNFLAIQNSLFQVVGGSKKLVWFKKEE
jgi:hypothetical protein